MRHAFTSFVCALVLAPLLAAAQDPSSDVTTYKLTGTRIAFGQDIRVERDEEVSDAVVAIGGSVTVDGRVRDGIVVVGGNLTLGATSDVRGDIVLVGGQLTRDPAARQSGSVSYVSFGEWSRRTTGWFPRFDFGEVGRWLSLAGTLARVSLLGVLMALLLIVARGAGGRGGRAAAAAPRRAARGGGGGGGGGAGPPPRGARGGGRRAGRRRGARGRGARVGRAAASEPVRAALVGLAAEIFFVPFLVVASIAMAVTIVGIPFVALLVPIALVVALFAMVLGYTALACRIGEWIEDRLGWQPGNAFVATAMGFAAIIAPTLAARLLGVAPDPVRLMAFGLLLAGLAVEFVVWTIGLGAAIITGLGRWHTVPPPIVVQS